MERKTVYLTIDDAPTYCTRRKVDFLHSKNVPAVLFCIGKSLLRRPQEAIYAIRHGFVLGNHSYSHQRFSELPLQKCLEEIKVADDILESLYKRANVSRHWKLFRFPYGDKGGGSDFKESWPENRKSHIKGIQRYLRHLGYAQPDWGITYKWYARSCLDAAADVVWTLDSKDWQLSHRSTPDQVAVVIRELEEDHPERGRGLKYLQSNDIMLFHDIPELETMFELAITRSLDTGIRFASLPCKTRSTKTEQGKVDASAA